MDILAQHASASDRRSEDLEIDDRDLGRRLKLLCPISFCPIEEAAVGSTCTHVQVFDLAAWIAVNERMRSLEKRWTCPVCGTQLRPDEVQLDPFAQEILNALQGEEDRVEAVVFEPDGTCSVVAIPVKGEDREDSPTREQFLAKGCSNVTTKDTTANADIVDIDSD